MGKNIITAIQLELSSKNQDNIVARILTLLNELLDEQTTQETQAEADLASKEDYCTSTRESYEGQISSKSSDIANAESSLPVLSSELESAQSNLADQEGKRDRATQELNEVNDINAQAVAAFEKSIRNHNAMIEALKSARALIVQLQSSSFLQKNNAVLAQIQNHRASSLKTLEGHSGKALYNLLMQMAQDVGIQADQQLVSSVVEVIDDLLKNEGDGVEAETQAEDERVSEYNQKVNDLESAITNASEEVTRLEGEIVRIGNEIDDTKNNIDTWNGQLADLETILSQHNDQCDRDISNYNSLIEELNEQIDVIRQVIAIFEGQSIQDIKPLVEDLSYTE